MITEPTLYLVGKLAGNRRGETRRHPSTKQINPAAFAGGAGENPVKVTIELPERLLKWAQEDARNLNEPLSVFVQGLLEAERYRCARLFASNSLDEKKAA